MDNIEAYAALLEAQQANRDFKEAYADPRSLVWASKEDYAVWSLAGYADTAERVLYDMSMG